MQLKSIRVDNFKSLVGFQLDLARFTCLIGLNGAGKSTLLQFIDFMAQLVRGRLDEWLQERNWVSEDLHPKVGAIDDESIVNFSATFIEKPGAEIKWTVMFDADLLRCIRETIETAGAALRVRQGKYDISGATGASAADKGPVKIPFTYQGSILSQLEESLLPRPMRTLKAFLAGTESLDMLTPDRLRQRTRSADGSLGRGGGRLSAFVYELGPAGRKDLGATLKKAYGQVRRVYAKSLRAGWKQLHIKEKFR